jgi:hypothetical protein
MQIEATAKEVSQILKTKLPTITIIESSSSQGKSVAEVRLGNEVRYLSLVETNSFSTVSLR